MTLVNIPNNFLNFDDLTRINGACVANVLGVWKLHNASMETHCSIAIPEVPTSNPSGGNFSALGNFLFLSLRNVFNTNNAHFV